MLHLQTRVHLHEVELPRLRDELDGAGADVVDRARGPHGRLAHPGPERRVDRGRRGLLDHLLVAALHRAVPLEQVQRVAAGVRQHLYLDVLGARQEPFEQHPVVAEGGPGLASRRLRGRAEPRGVRHEPHALAAAAGRGLDEEREADGLRLLRERVGVLVVTPW